MLSLPRLSCVQQVVLGCCELTPRLCRLNSSLTTCVIIRFWDVLDKRKSYAGLLNCKIRLPAMPATNPISMSAKRPSVNAIVFSTRENAIKEIST